MGFWLTVVTAVIHIWVAAGWFGAMAYSLALLQPRPKGYFGGEQQYETFIATISQGARWPVLAAISFIAVTGGVNDAALARAGVAGLARAVAAKALLTLAAIAIFIYICSGLWPRRIFAMEAALAAIRSRFKAAGLTLLSIAAGGDRARRRRRLLSMRTRDNTERKQC